jgi:hypothetical protein
VTLVQNARERWLLYDDSTVFIMPRASGTVAKLLVHNAILALYVKDLRTVNVVGLVNGGNNLCFMISSFVFCGCLPKLAHQSENCTLCGELKVLARSISWNLPHGEGVRHERLRQCAKLRLVKYLHDYQLLMPEKRSTTGRQGDWDMLKKCPSTENLTVPQAVFVLHYD